MKRFIQIALLAACALLILGEGACLATGIGLSFSASPYDKGFAPIILVGAGLALLITSAIGYGLWRWYRASRADAPQ